MTLTHAPRSAATVTALDPEHGILVGGRWLAGSSGTFEVEDPATGAVVARVADGDPADATAAVDAAAAAQPGWAARSPRERSDLLQAVRTLMLRDQESLAALIALENGKSLSDARGEVVYAAEFFRWYAEEAVRPQGDFGSAPAGGSRAIVTHAPVGVAALVTPWNFPAAMATRKIAPALAAGCTVVLKPAAETPLTALAVARLIAEAGIPDGVVNVVPGLDAPAIVSTWIEDARVRKLSFTGSTGVGRALLRQAAERVLNTSMELGGNAPFVVLPGADMEAAVDGAMIAKFRNGGQACTAANRFYVHADLVEQFTDSLGSRVEALRVGAAAEGADIGPLISARAVARVSSLVEDAVSRGARIVGVASLPDAPGHFAAPTVLADVPSDAAVVQEEIFGPVAPIVSWRDPGELLAMVNGTEYGLAAYVYGALGDALCFGERIEAGMVGINRGLVSDPATPFGGVKQSGIGREGARVGLDEYLETKLLSVGWAEPSLAAEPA